MKRILCKRQIQTIILLSAVIFILLCGVAYTVSTRTTTAVDNTPAGAEKPPHELLRAARPSANEHIAWETNLGGTGRETPVTVLQKNNEIFVFGNTDSADLDFAGKAADKTRGFCARLSLLGRTLSFTVFDFTVAKAIPVSEGFAVAGNEGSVAGIYLLSDDLTQTGKANMPTTHALTAVGLYEFDNRYFLVASAYNDLTQKTSLLLHIYTKGLSREYEKVFAHSYGLELLDILPYNGGYLLAASAQLQSLGCLTLFRFSAMSEPVPADIDLGHAYAPTAFMPLGDGYAAVCDNGGNCEILLIDADLQKSNLHFSSKTPNANRKTLFYAGGAYAYTGEKLLKLSDDGRIVGTLDLAVQRITDYCYNGVAAFAAGITPNGITVVMIGAQATQTRTFAAKEPQTALLCAGNSSVLFAADTSGATADCGDFFGGTDVWIGKMPLTA